MHIIVVCSMMNMKYNMHGKNEDNLSIIYISVLILYSCIIDSAKIKKSMLDTGERNEIFRV